MWAQEAPDAAPAPAAAEAPPPYWLTLPPYDGPYPVSRPPDRDCPNFGSWEDAQRYFLAAGGPDDDPHRIGEGGVPGIACEALPGSPVENGVVVGTPAPGPQR